MADARPLDGRTVVVTRSRDQASELVALLEAFGARVLCFPTIAFVDPEDTASADDAVASLASYDWVLFTSANAVERFLARMAEHGVGAGALRDVRVAAVGQVTAAKLAGAGVMADLVPDEHRAEGLLEGLLERGAGEGTRILLPRALEARETLPDTLRGRGAVVDVVPVYRTVLGPGDPDAAAALEAREVDAVTFTSGSTVRNFVTLIGPEHAARVLEGVAVASIGPVTTEAARALGLTVAVEATPYTTTGLAEALATFFSA